MKIRLFISLLLFLITHISSAEVVRYEFDVTYQPINITGQTARSIAVGGSIPAPTITATVGDILEVSFHNKLDVETSIHWHGILLPNDQDGVPYLTTMPIKAGTSFTYRFPIKHHGTYWYHSHTNLQEQRGVYGALVFHPQQEIITSDYDYVVVLSDWTDEAPQQVLMNLKRDGHYYALKKDSVQPWNEVIARGTEAIKNRLQASWIRMGTMDIADVGYDAFLANGHPQVRFDKPKSGETVRLRLINAAASSFFNIEFAGGNMTIVSADGIDVEPLQVKRLRMAIAETYDVLVTLPDDNAYELRATVDDVTGYASVVFGDGKPIAATDMPRPDLFAMRHHHTDHGAEHSQPQTPTNATATDQHHQHHQHDDTMQVQPLLDRYQQLRARQPTSLDPDRPMREIKLSLTGDMERYIWSFDNKTLTEADRIIIRQGENVRFVLANTTMMHHPLHLHGHFFRVLNGQGDRSPLKHTVNVPPLDTITIEFYANEDKDWFFHCHNLYHMKTGMARVVRYAGSQTSPQLLAAKKSARRLTDNTGVAFSQVGVHSNKIEWLARWSNIRNTIELDLEHNYDDAYEIETLYQRHFTRFFSGTIGIDMEQEDSDSESAATLGVRYMLPLLINVDLQTDTNGNGEIEFSSEIDLSKKIHFEWQWKTDGEYEFELNYTINEQWSGGINYSDEYNAGIGINIKF